MNFSQHWRTPGIVDVPYHIELPQPFVVDLLGQHLPDYIEDCKNFPDPESGIERALEAAGWPSASEVLTMPDLARYFVRLFGYDLLAWWLVDGPTDDERDFVLNTIDSIEVRDDVVALGGTARRTGMPVRYQDD